MINQHTDQLYCCESSLAAPSPSPAWHPPHLTGWGYPPADTAQPRGWFHKDSCVVRHFLKNAKVNRNPSIQPHHACQA